MYKPVAACGKRRGSIARAQSFANEVLNPIGAGFSEKYHVSRLSILGHCFDVMSLGKALNPHLVHLTQVKTKDRDANVYDKLNASKLLQDCYALRGLNEQVNVYYFKHTI